MKGITIKPEIEKGETQREWLGRCMRSKEVKKVAIELKKNTNLHKSIYEIQQSMCGAMWGGAKIDKALIDNIPKPPEY